MIYLADYVVTLSGEPIKEGVVQINEGRITSVGKLEEISVRPEEPVLELAETVLLPGLINTHCHLELGHARGMFPKKESFSMWVSRLQNSMKDLKSETIRESIRLGSLECIRSGTTSIFDVGNTMNNFLELFNSSLRSWINYEALGLDPESGTERFLRIWSQIKSQYLNDPEKLSSRIKVSTTAHAPYSCSLKLLKMVNEENNKIGNPFSIHVMESREEDELFTLKSGRLFEFCKRRYSEVPYHKGEDGIEYLLNHKLIPDGSILAHCNFIKDETAETLAEKNVSVVHCPRSRAFFDHPHFPYEMSYNAGVNVCFGTDSLASNENYSLFDEMSEFRNQYPQVDCKNILKMATINGATALGYENELGKLSKGYLADMIGIRFNHDPGGDIYDEIVCEDHEITFVMIDGEEILI